MKCLPNSPGVYLFLNKSKKPIYIGKAGSLKKRIASYFFKKDDSRISEMVSEAKDIEYQRTDSVLEALVLEANLIKKYWPKYNIREKDNTSFVYLVISKKDDFPRPMIVRGRELGKYLPSLKTFFPHLPSRIGGIKGGTKHNPSSPPLNIRGGRQNAGNQFDVFGPYQSYYLLKTALALVRKIFPFCTKGMPDSYEVRLRKNLTKSDFVRLKPCFHYQIGQCPGVCIGKITSKEYKKILSGLRLFFAGDKKRLLARLKKDASINAAQEIPDKLRALQHVQDVALLAHSNTTLAMPSSLLRRIEGYDISHLSGREPVGAMVVFENGEADTSQYRLFKIRGKEIINHSDTDMLKEVLMRRFRHTEWRYPDIIFVDGGLGQTRAVKKILDAYKIKIPVVGLAKTGGHSGSAYVQDKLIINGDRKETRDLIINNKHLFQRVRNEAHRFAISFQKRRRNKNRKP